MSEPTVETVTRTYIFAGNSNDEDDLVAFLYMYDGWKDDFDKTQNSTICYYFTIGDFYFIAEGTYDIIDGVEYADDDTELVGFVTVDNLHDELKSVDHIWIKKDKRRKGHATIAMEELKAKGVSFVSQVSTPDGDAFLKGINWKRENV